MLQRLIITAMALLIAASSLGATYPPGLSITLERLYVDGSHPLDTPVRIWAYFFVAETGPLSGFYYSEQLPPWIDVHPDLITINGMNHDFHMEVGAEGEVVDGRIPYRWIIDDPMTGNGTVLNEGDQVLISYLIYARASGILVAEYEGWFGFLEGAGGVPVFGDDERTLELQFGEAVGVADAPAASLRLAPAHPNPFNPVTRLSFSTESPRDLRLDIVDARGRHVATLFDGPAEAGEHSVTWRGRDESGRPQPSGLYFARLVDGHGLADTQKLLLLK